MKNQRELNQASSVITYTKITKLMMFSLLGLLATGTTAHAQNTEPAPQTSDTVQVVEVSGMKNPELKSYRQMVKGIDAFEKFHSLAPAATLKFQLISETREVAFDAVTLRLSGDATEVALAIGHDGTFVLPRIASAAADNAALVSNMPKGLLRWRGDVHSPDVPANARRIGDLRLECEVGWEINQEDMSFVARNSLSLLGGLCHSKMIGLRSQAPRPLVSVTLVSGPRKLALQIEPGAKRIFWPPLADMSWDDDSLIVFEFADPDAKP